MTPIPNPWISDSACIADTADVSFLAPVPGASAEVIQGPATGSLSYSLADTAAGASASPAPAAFFNPGQDFMNALYARIMDDLSDLHPRDLDLPLPKFLSDPSPEYLAILSGASHADTDPDHHDRIHLRAVDRRARHRA